MHTLNDIIPAPVRQFAIAGDSVDHARRTYQDAYGGTRFSVDRSDDDFAFRYASLGDDRVTLRTSNLTGHLSGEIPHLREYVVSWFREGSGEVRRQAGARRAGTPMQVRPVAAGSDAALVASPSAGSSVPFLFPSEQRFDFRFAPHRQNLIHFAPDFLEDIATEFHSGARRVVSFDHDARPSVDAVARWRAAVSAAARVLVDAAASPLLRMNAQRPLARSLLQLFPWFGVDVPQVLRQPPLARLRVALEYFHHHAHEPITPADAAKAAGLHTRTLQQQTRRHLGMSPSAFLRTVRLDRAYRDLVDATPETRTVQVIAREWGFGHPGRFATAYQARFGQRPFDTLRT